MGELYEELCGELGRELYWVMCWKPGGKLYRELSRELYEGLHLRGYWELDWELRGEL